MKDIIIVGAGVTGAALARVLSRYEASVLVLEAGPDLASGASKANSGIVHAGYDAVPGTWKARMNVEGARMYPALCEELGVPYRKNGALVVAFSEEDRRTLEELLEQGVRNGVEHLEIVESEELHRMEPQLSEKAVCALSVPDSGITSPYEMTFALADHAAVNGVEFRFICRVQDVRREDGVWHVQTVKGEECARILINCAGSGSGRLHEQICGRDDVRIVNRRGQYYLLDHPEVLPFDHTMFQCPTAMGKGVLVAPTVHGNVLLGPTAEDIPDAEDTDTTREGLDAVLKACSLTWPGYSVRTAITNFAGVRAHEVKGDFIIGRIDGAEQAYEAAGMESPGLSAAPAVGVYLGELIAREEGLKEKKEWKKPLKREKPFNEMTLEEREEAVHRDPLNGTLICRCEVVTEAEIRAAIRRPVGATTLDGVKRRTRAGMGRCQGGFCSPRVTEILAEELGIAMEDVRKDGPGSWLLCGDIQSAMRGEADA